jgi:hypothetical protein
MAEKKKQTMDLEETEEQKAAKAKAAEEKA